MHAVICAIHGVNCTAHCASCGAVAVKYAADQASYAVKVVNYLIHCVNYLINCVNDAMDGVTDAERGQPVQKLVTKAQRTKSWGFIFPCALCASVAKIPVGGGKRGLIIICRRQNLEIVKRRAIFKNKLATEAQRTQSWEFSFSVRSVPLWQKIPADGGKSGLIIIGGQHTLEIVKRDWRQNQWPA